MPVTISRSFRSGVHLKGHHLPHPASHVNATYIKHPSPGDVDKVYWKKRKNKDRHIYVVSCHSLGSPVYTLYHVYTPCVTCIQLVSPVFILCHLYSPCVTCIHLVSPVFTLCHLYSPCVTCVHLVSPVYTLCHLYSHYVTCVHIVSPAYTVCHLYSPYVTCIHIVSPIFTLCHLYSHCVTCIHLVSPVYTLCHLYSPCVTCIHLVSLVFTLCHLWWLAANIHRWIPEHMITVILWCGNNFIVRMADPCSGVVATKMCRYLYRRQLPFMKGLMSLATCITPKCSGSCSYQVGSFSKLRFVYK